MLWPSNFQLMLRHKDYRKLLEFQQDFINSLTILIRKKTMGRRRADEL
jgi:hypothetical protein